MVKVEYIMRVSLVESEKPEVGGIWPGARGLSHSLPYCYFDKYQGR